MLRIVFITLLGVAPVRHGHAEEENWTEPCAFREGGAVQYESDTSCGAGGFCSTEWTATIDGLTVEDRGYGLAPVIVRCTPGEAVLSSEKGDAGPIRLEYLESDGVFRLAPDVRRRIEEVSRMPAGPSAVRAALRLVMGMSYVPSIAGAALYDAALILARAQLATGDWSGAEHTIGTWANPSPEPDWARRKSEIAAGIERAKSTAAPLRWGVARRLGTIPRMPVSPPFDASTLFWRGATLCVVQDDTPDRMRCYDTKQRRWGALEPTVRPASPLVPGGSGTICGSVDHYSVRGLESTASSGCGQFRANEIIGAASGPTILLDRGGLQVWTAGGTKPATAAEASRVALEGAGSRLVGGEYVLLYGVTYGAAGKTEPTYTLIPGRPADNQDWSAISALASPDQAWVVAFSVDREHPSSSPYTLWLLSSTQP